MFNKVIMVGNLTRDIELRYAQTGSAIANTAIATTRKFTVNGERKEEVCFTDITFFGKSAETANQYLRKGSKILVEGRLKLDQWQDKDGGKRSKHSIIVETMQMLDGKPQQEQDTQQSQQQPHTAYQPQQAQQPQQNNYGNQMPPQQSYIPDMDEDEVPF